MVHVGVREWQCAAKASNLKNRILLFIKFRGSSVDVSLQGACATSNGFLELRTWVRVVVAIGVKVLNGDLDRTAKLLTLCRQNALAEQMVLSRLRRDDVDKRTFDLADPANVGSDLLLERADLAVSPLARKVVLVIPECKCVAAEIHWKNLVSKLSARSSKRSSPIAVAEERRSLPLLLLLVLDASRECINSVGLRNGVLVDTLPELGRQVQQPAWPPSCEGIDLALR